MAKFRKKPVEIDAWQWHKDQNPWTSKDCPHWIKDCERLSYLSDGSALRIETLEGSMIASDGDWIIRGVKGEIYPCKPDIFALTYEPSDAVQPFKATDSDIQMFDTALFASSEELYVVEPPDAGQTPNPISTLLVVSQFEISFL